MVVVKKKRKNPKFEFTNERLTYFMKFTIQHVVYVMKQLVSPKMFTNERLFTIQRLLFGDSTVLLTGATRRFSKDKTLTAIRF